MLEYGSEQNIAQRNRETLVSAYFTEVFTLYIYSTLFVVATAMAVAIIISAFSAYKSCYILGKCTLWNDIALHLLYSACCLTHYTRKPNAPKTWGCEATSQLYYVFFFSYYSSFCFIRTFLLHLHLLYSIQSCFKCNNTHTHARTSTFL